MVVQANFQVWDAPSYGELHPRMTEASTNGETLESLTLLRSPAAGDTVNLRISSFLPDSEWEKKSIAHSALLAHVQRLAEETDDSLGSAAQRLVSIAHESGSEGRLRLEGHQIDCWLYVVPETGDWAAVATGPGYAIGVAGEAGVDVPALSAVDADALGVVLEEL